MAVLAALAALLTLAWAAAPAQATTQTFTYTGAEQTFKVPGGVTSIHVVAIGGAGGINEIAGGEAAKVVGDISVTPGATLYLEVGGNGLSSGLGGGLGGFNGGGDGGSSAAGGGGGASDIRTSPLEDGLAPDLRLIVAAGGGGTGAGGEASAGAAGGAAGSDGSDTTTGNPGGKAGTATEGGAGGVGFFGTGGTGQLGLGGVGGASGFSGGTGGGGGGGYYGGGGGGGGEISGGGGGGGGSSLIPPSGSKSLTASPPQVELTYTLVPPTIAITTPANGATYQQGQLVKASYSCTPPEGTIVEACEGPVANGAAIDTSTLGPHAFEVEAEDKDGAEASEEVTYTVVAPPSISITSPANGATFIQGQAVTAIYSCTPAGGTGVKTCAGPVANGAALDTAALGSHSFEVKAEDLDGGKATQSVSYTVVSPKQGPPPPPVAPDTVLGSHPKKTIKTEAKKVKVKFTFSSTTAGATFKCKLDKGAFAPCTSPKRYKVKLGKHTFSVEAVSAGGTDPTPAPFSFKVKKKS